MTGGCFAMWLNVDNCPLVNYLLNYRLQWGKQDTLSILPSRLFSSQPKDALSTTTEPSNPLNKDKTPVLPPIPDNAPPYFTADTPPELISVIMNDWPYSGTLSYPKLCFHTDPCADSKYCISS